MNALKRAVAVLDSISIWTGRLLCWLVIPLMAVLVYEAVARKFFVSPTSWALDASYMLTGTFGMAGAVYALYRGAHIRADFISQRWSPRVQGAVDALLYLVCFFPGMLLFLRFGWRFAYNSWLEGERAITSSWMPPLYPLKFVMAVATTLLLLQGVSEFLKSCYVAVEGKRL